MWLIAVKIDKKKNVYFLVLIAIPDCYPRFLSGERQSAASKS